MAYQSMGDLAQARTSLDRALVIGQASGFLRTFADKGKVLQNLLTEMLASLRSESDRGNTGRRSRMNYLDRVLAAFPRQEEQVAEIAPIAGPSPISAKTGEICQISERELEVLRYLAGYLTVPEIASELYLSPHTVRSHVKSIYSKLNAHNRSEAILRARELGLL
jgi:LuxR family maltose regulon positive regulatory protein